MAAMTWCAAIALVIAAVMPASAQTLSGAEFLAAPAGSYVIYFRHADIDRGHGEPGHGRRHHGAVRRAARARVGGTEEGPRRVIHPEAQ